MMALHSENKARASTIVLVVEDEALIRFAVTEYLRCAGYCVTEAESADEAIELFKQNTEVDVVFTDVQLPGTTNGLGLAAWVRQHRPGVRTILTSGHQQSALDARLHCPEDPFVSKPYNLGGVHFLIRGLLSERRDRH